jgi:hypothetical protein
MTQTLLSNGASPNSNSHLRSNIYSPLTHSRAHANAYVRTRLMTHNSYAVPKEVGKVGVESSTFIEPVQKRKDGIEAMFTRQVKAAQEQQQPKSESRDAPPAATAGSGKRKREPAEEKGEEKEMGTAVSTTAAPSSPAKRSKVNVKKDPIKLDDSVDSEEGNSDVEIVPYGPSSSPSQSQSVRHPTIPDLLARAQLMTDLRLLFLVFLGGFFFGQLQKKKNETRRSKAAKPKTKKEEDDIADHTPTGSQQQQQTKKVSHTNKHTSKRRENICVAQRSAVMCQITSSLAFLPFCWRLQPLPSFRSIMLIHFISPPQQSATPSLPSSPRKKNKQDKPDSSSQSTPKITSFFAKFTS